MHFSVRISEPDLEMQILFRGFTINCLYLVSIEEGARVRGGRRKTKEQGKVKHGADPLFSLENVAFGASRGLRE